MRRSSPDSTSIDVLLVAEGVETSAERDTLLGLGVTAAQGYLFGRPLPADEALGRLAYTCKITRAAAASLLAVQAG